MRVFITGASSGIGAALARYYAEQGAQLGLVGRNQVRLAAVCAEIGGNCGIYPLDVRDADALRAAAHDFMSRFGAPDIVIANAGVSRGTLTEFAEDTSAFQSVMDTNVMGIVHTFQPFISAMKMTNGGSLVGIASVAGLRGLPGSGAYSASKAAAINYLESLRVELASSDIAVTTICPGYIRTPMTDINPYRMPFLMHADVAAIKMGKIIKRKTRFAILPWQMNLIGKLMRILPASVWDKLVANAPHKPRLEIE